ncbi:abortive infection family protein [Micavibrio aeruginosavorus]|uniref:Abortive infection protein-like C-terminal domain-containing protein n=1 Tax=Micavibrio aeruginosavorus (strain ARL-13) TaxID=856793 RepID=G2KRK8_MICAA|nr:abortive infection family protein [Micavibrio aeruginosavorus]AEP09570.1 hypothetical protein MICA_1247 [Micavibrio aeruginosavorus ARL-13]
MEKLKREIHRTKRHNLDYYQSHLDLIENYIEEKPDISIESCKAVIEGISKLALHILLQEPLETHKDEKLQPIFKRALVELQKGRGFSDADLCNRLGNVVQYIGQLRNDHGDISHGRASLKEQVNDADFAELITGITENLGTYMLKRLDYLAEPITEYDDNTDFNTYLDELNPMPDNVLYSKALFEQWPITYDEQLGDYKLQFEADEE